MSEFKTHIIEKETQTDDVPRKVVLEEALEAILFAAGHEISYATLARVFDITPHKAKEYVIAYAECYNHSDTPRGVELLTFPDSCQLVTKQHYLSEIRDTLGLKKTGTISTSSMETLAIIAYNQPVTRVFVDTLRRADSSYAMTNLLDRGLIECKGRLDVPGRPMLYGTTSDFLRCFGLSDLSGLPQTTEELNAMFQKAQSEAEPKPEEIEGGEQLNLFDGETANPTNEEDTSHEIPTEDIDNGPSADDDIHFEDTDEDETEENIKVDVDQETIEVAENEETSMQNADENADGDVTDGNEENDLPFPEVE